MIPTSNAFRRSLVALAALFAVACGKEEPRQCVGASPEGPLLPWSEGNSWTYRVTEAGGETTKVTTIGVEEPVGGSGPNRAVMAFKVVTSKGASQADQTVSWQAPEGQRIVRYREQAFHAVTGVLELEEHWDPWKLHVDGAPEHLVKGASWLEAYRETKIVIWGGTPPGIGSGDGGLGSSGDGGPEPGASLERRDRWMVLADRECVTVPAGTFEAVVLRKLPSDKTYWYVRGVGKVRETGGQTEELVDYEVAR